MRRSGKDEGAGTGVPEPCFSRNYFALGQIMADQGDFTPAVDNLQKAVQLDPVNPGYHYNLGLAWRLKADTPATVERFRETVKLDPNHALARRSLGLVFAGDGRIAGRGGRASIGGRAVSRRSGGTPAGNGIAQSE